MSLSPLMHTSVPTRLPVGDEDRLFVALHEEAFRHLLGDDCATLHVMTPDLRATGIDAVIEAYKQDIDRTLLRENLRRTPDERLRALMELQRFAEELRRAGTSSRRNRR